jgi:hypothetical protein
LIFYPGGKVQYEAYAPLLERLSENGIFCVLVHMPANLAVFDVNAADDIREMYPDIENWYIGGHSYFGSYGMQEGDGEPTITREEQMAQNVEAILIQINEER